MKTALLKNKGFIALTIFFSLIVSLGSVLVAVLLQRIIDAAVKGNMELFQQTLFISVFYVPLLGLFGYLYSISSKALIRGWTVTLRENVFRGILRRDFEEFSKTNTADYLSALSNDIKLIEENYVQPLLLTLQNMIIFVASLLLMLFISPLVTGILIGCVVLLFTVPTLFGKALQKRQKAVSIQMSLFTSKLKDMLSGYEVIRSYSMSHHVEKIFAQENETAANTKFTADRTLALNEGISEILGALTQFAVVFIAAYLILTGKLSAGSLVALVQLSNGFVGPVMMIMQNVPRIQGVKPVVERFNALADYENDVFEGKIQPAFHHKLEASQLSFAYTEGRNVLSNIDLTLLKGKKYALVGPSGCGKSTLVKLLTGCYAGYDGTITYDGVELKQLDRAGVQQLSSTIHQQVYMFDTDIRDNICLYESYSEEKIISAVQKSGIEQVISQLPNGLSSAVGENGSNFSGGQRQRMAVARALIRNLPILILDEGTSAVDMQTAYEIETRLLAVPDLTLITITHNMNPDVLGLYDQIIYMEEGRIAGMGSFEELLQQHERFRKFITLDTLEAI
ncbi:ABC transporter ATP-binding protein [Paenibacillus lemnae]|uniref:ABC transporter ATP-binding protein n=1 Tax=Paenibacillus lemnae TaxID=1330551 RepID=A0A848M8T4_PAELE|nr:ABC transporter ATP-binding protein [Paenibacillus lemnae]NMO97016.1 ABC transporter ATP-binding protein [Paenibacillus lemnae]